MLRSCWAIKCLSKHWQFSSRQWGNERRKEGEKNNRNRPCPIFWQEVSLSWKRRENRTMTYLEHDRRFSSALRRIGILRTTITQRSRAIHDTASILLQSSSIKMNYRPQCPNGQCHFFLLWSESFRFISPPRWCTADRFITPPLFPRSWATLSLPLQSIYLLSVRTNER